MKHPNMKPPRTKKSVERGGPADTATPFDLWLNRGLHEIYDTIANEPIPEDLLKLIGDDRAPTEDDPSDQQT